MDWLQTVTMQTWLYSYLTPFLVLFFTTTEACIVHSTIILFSSIRSFIYATISSKTMNTIRYVTSTTKNIHYFNRTKNRHKTKHVALTQSYTIQHYHWTIQSPVQITKLNVWKHTTKTLKRLVLGGHRNTSQQRPSNYEFTGSALYGVPHTLRMRLLRWFPDPQRRPSKRQPTASGPTTWHHDGDRQRWRLTKTEADEDEDRLTLGMSEVAAPLQLTTPQSEHRTWPCYFSSIATRWLPSPWRLQQSLQSQVQSFESPLSSRSWTCFQKKKKTWGYEALTVPSGRANWSDGRLTIKR